MKISKLFHWLYALVMLLPIFAIGVTCGYAMFNKNAYLSYGDNYIKNISVVNDASLLQPNNNYSFNPKAFYYNASAYTNGGKYIFNSSSVEDWNYYFTEEIISPQQNESINGFVFYKGTGTDYRLNLYNDNTLIKSFINGQNQVNFRNLDTEIYFNLNSIGSWVIGSYTNTYSANSTYLITYELASLSDVFYYSMEKVQQSPLFNWAYNSFLVAPFSYIVSLFSMPTNSFVVMLLSYWLAISIIWLVFDLVMYVPLLIHRWIDKGVLE